MSKPTEIYKGFTRELLENFLWQLQASKSEYVKALFGGVEPGTDLVLAYSFECPSLKSAESLKSYIREQAEDDIGVEQQNRKCHLSGKSSAFAFDLGTILEWVGYMCDAGSQFGCRFDGWTPVKADAAEQEESEALLDDDAEEAIPARDTLSYPYVVIAKIPEKVEPVTRGEKYEDPLTAELKKRGLGEVTGGGSQLNTNFEIESVDIEIGLTNLDEALEVTRETLRKLGAPKGSEIRFAREIVVPITE